MTLAILLWEFCYESRIFIFQAVSVLGFLFFVQFVLAPSVIWASDTGWSTGAFANTTNITGDLMLNNTII